MPRRASTNATPASTIDVRIVHAIAVRRTDRSHPVNSRRGSRGHVSLDIELGQQIGLDPLSCLVAVEQLVPERLDDVIECHSHMGRAVVPEQGEKRSGQAEGRADLPSVGRRGARGAVVRPKQLVGPVDQVNLHGRSDVFRFGDPRAPPAGPTETVFNPPSIRHWGRPPGASGGICEPHCGHRWFSTTASPYPGHTGGMSTKNEIGLAPQSAVAQGLGDDLGTDPRGVSQGDGQNFLHAATGGYQW